MPLTLPKAVEWAAGLLSLLPGVSLFTSGLWAPPGQEKMFGGVMLITGTLLLLVLRGYAPHIAAWSRSRMVVSVAALAVGGLAALGAYGHFRGITVLEDKASGVMVEDVADPSRARVKGTAVRTDTVYMPLLLRGDVAKYVSQYGGRQRAVDALRAEPVRSAIAHEPGAIVFTNAVFLALYLVMNATVISALLISAWNADPDHIPTAAPVVATPVQSNTP